MGRQVREVIPEAGDGEGVRGVRAPTKLGLASRDEPGDLGLDLRHDAIGRAHGTLMPPEATEDALGERGPQHDRERLQKADEELHMRVIVTPCRKTTSKRRPSSKRETCLTAWAWTTHSRSHLAMS